MDIGILPEFRTTAMRLGAKSWRCAARLAMCAKLALTDAGNVGPASVELRAAGEEGINRSAD
jgi:hypothetical protein